VNHQPAVKKKASGGDYDSAMVSCGNHEAKNCAACPQGHGAGRCNGDCVWKDDQCHHGPTTVATTVPITVPTPTVPTPVPTTLPTTVPATVPSCAGKYHRNPLDFVRHPCPPGTEITTESECVEAAQYFGTGGWGGGGKFYHAPQIVPQCSTIHNCKCFQARELRYLLRSHTPHNCDLIHSRE